MKRNFHLFSLTVILIFGFTLLFQGCKKKEHFSDFVNQPFSPRNNDCFSNELNHYDTSSVYLGQVFYNYLGVLDSTMEEPISVFESRIFVSDSVFKSDYHEIIYQEEVSEIESEFYRDFISLITEESLSDMSNFMNGVYMIEYDIANSELDSLERERSLSAISMMKYTYYYFQLLGSEHSIYRTWEERVSSCIRTELDEIFVYGDIWDQAQFIAGIPGSFAWIVGKCHYIATFGPGVLNVPEVNLAIPLDNTCFNLD